MAASILSVISALCVTGIVALAIYAVWSFGP
jgi:hypothetical protein